MRICGHPGSRLINSIRDPESAKKVEAKVKIKLTFVLRGIEASIVGVMIVALLATVNTRPVFAGHWCGNTGTVQNPNAQIEIPAAVGIWTDRTMSIAFDNRFKGEGGNKLQWTEAQKNVIQEAMKEWADLGFKLTEVSPTEDPDVRLYWFDPESSLALANTDFGAGGKGTINFRPDPTDPETGSSLPWYVDPNPRDLSRDNQIPTDSLDLLTVAKHELGHALGLNHVPFSDSVMEVAGAEPGTRQRVTSHDAELIGILYSFPCTPTPSPTVLEHSSVILEGDYDEQFYVASDVDKHAEFVGMPQNLKLHVQLGSITVSGPAPFVRVTGPLNTDGTFDATGAGDVAGRHVIGVEFVGRISSAGLLGKYAMGVKVPAIVNGRPDFGGFLPGGQPIIFSVQGQRSGSPLPTPVAIATPIVIAQPLKTFLSSFIAAIRTNDTAFLYDHLHPAVVNLYGSDQCQSFVKQRRADPTYNIETLGAQGPAPWQWVADGVSTLIQNVYTVDANVTGQGQKERAQVHFAQFGNTLYWFTDCGNLRATPTPTR